MYITKQMGTGGPVSSALGNGQIANSVNAVKKLRIPHTRESSWISWTGFLGWVVVRICSTFPWWGKFLNICGIFPRMWGCSWTAQACFTDRGNFLNIRHFYMVLVKALNISGMILWMRWSSWICQTCFSDDGKFFNIAGRSPRIGCQTTYHKWQSKTKSTADLTSWPERNM